MARLLAASDDYDALVLDLSDVPFVDSSASLGLEDAIKQAQGHDKTVYVVGVRPDVAKTLNRLGVLKLLPVTHHHVSRLDALKQAEEDLASPEPVEQTFVVLSRMVDRLEELIA